MSWPIARPRARLLIWHATSDTRYKTSTRSRGTSAACGSKATRPFEDGFLIELVLGLNILKALYGYPTLSASKRDRGLRRSPARPTFSYCHFPQGPIRQRSVRFGRSLGAPRAHHSSRCPPGYRSKVRLKCAPRMTRKTSLRHPEYLRRVEN